jgi:hypothetical protein
MHALTLVNRMSLVGRGRPVPGDTKEGIARLLKRAALVFPWPDLPPEGLGGRDQALEIYLRSLVMIARSGEPEAAVEILSRHVQEIERRVLSPRLATLYCLSHLDLFVSAAVKFEGDEGKSGAYVAEAKGAMVRATRSLRGLQLEDWDCEVRISATSS